MPNKLTEMAREILAIECDLPYRFSYRIGEKPTVDDFELHIFEQTCGSTALGFGGYGGQMKTTAFIYVFYPICVDQKCLFILQESLPMPFPSERY